MNTAEDTRRKELAKIHIAKKDLVLDDETYRTIVRTIGKAESGSAADLSPLGRARVLHHFRSNGWKSSRRDRQPKRATPEGDIPASAGQVGKIRSFWIQMADAGAVKERSEQALRAWVKSASRRHHQHHAGWSAPEFLPDWVAQKLIENIKAWAKRCNIKLNE